MFGEWGYAKNLKNSLKSGEEHGVKVWPAEEFIWKFVGVFAGNTKGFIYLQSRLY